MSVHILDDLIPQKILAQASRAFPAHTFLAQNGVAFSRPQETRKAALSSIKEAPGVQPLADFLASHEALQRISELVGIEGLLWDDGLRGGGLHSMESGSRLDVHVDFNRHGTLYRRANLIVFLNSYWEPTWGGQFEYWNEDVTKCTTRITPSLGRCILFATHPTSWHGVTPVRCPKGFARQTFAAYYYTTEPGSAYEGQEYGTRFVTRPNELFRKHFFLPGENLVRKAYRGASRIFRVGKRAEVKPGGGRA